MITEDYVSFETAKLLKEKGFNEKVYGYYSVKSDNDDTPQFGPLYNHNQSIQMISAPTLQMAIKWLNEVHHILVVSDYEYEFTDTSWYYKIYKFVDEHGKCKRWPVNAVRDIDGLEAEVTVAFRDYMRSYKDYATRREADEEGIRYVLENLI